MALRTGCFGKLAPLLVVAAATVGTAYASCLYECPLRGSEPSVTEGERVTIPTEGLSHKGAGFGAKVTMIECSDFECPFSKRASGTVDELLAHNDDLAFFHVHFPLGMFERSELEAAASVAAQYQGRFWPMHDALFAASIDSEDAAIELAGRLGLDTVRFAADLRRAATRAEVARQRALCKDAGVRGVPTFFINGRRVVGSIPVDQFQRVIDEERG
jgi:protein-disulfide isomerase